MLKIGEFYTSYSAGYWQLVDLKPKIVCQSKVAYEDGTPPPHKAGEVYGQWAILKKAFTPKMKPRIDFVFEDSSWLRPVSDEVQAEIDRYFAENPAYQKKFDTAPVKLRPMITNCWISVPSDNEIPSRRIYREGIWKIGSILCSLYRPPPFYPFVESALLSLEYDRGGGACLPRLLVHKA